MNNSHTMQNPVPYRDKPITVQVSFFAHELPPSIIILQPEIFTDGPDTFCCVHKHLIEGISGCDQGIFKAFKTFDEDFQRKRVIEQYASAHSEPYERISIPITFQANEIPESVIEHQPAIKTDDAGTFECFDEFVNKISGRGNSPLEAMIAYDNEIRKRAQPSST